MGEPAGYDVAPPKKRSGAIMALGILSVIYALLFNIISGIAGILYPLWAPTLVDFLEKRQAQIPTDVMLSSSVQAYSVINGFVIFVLGVLLLSGGIGLIMMRSWGRKLSIGIAGGEIIWVIITLFVNIFFLSPFITESLEETARGSQAGEIIIGTLLRILYPSILLIFLSSGSVKNRFESEPAQL